MKILQLIFFPFVVSLTLVSCSGGGGGGGGEDPNNRRTGVRVLHGAVEGAPVDLVGSLQGVIQTSKFAEAKGYSEFASGTQVLNLFRTKDLTSSLDTRQIVNQDRQKHTFVFYGDRDNFGFRTSLISEELPEVPDGRASIRIIHATVGAGNLEANLPSASIVAGFGSASTYASVTPGPLSIGILRSVDKTVIQSVSLVAQQGKAYTIFVAGEVDYLVISKILEEN